MEFSTTRNQNVDLDWDRLAAGLRQQLQDITTALVIVPASEIIAWDMLSAR